MKSILKSVLFIAFVMTFSFAAFAQKPHHKGKHNPEARLEKMKTELNLSDEQVTQIRAIFESKKERIQPLREEAKNGNADAKAKLKVEKEAIKAEIDKVLTPAQREKATTLHAQHKDPKVRAAKRTEKIKSKLGLNDSQSKQVEAALIEKMTKKQALKEAANGEKPNKDEMEKIHQEFEAKMKTILTAEQFTKFQEFKEEHHGKHKGKHGKRGNK